MRRKERIWIAIIICITIVVCVTMLITAYQSRKHYYNNEKIRIGSSENHAVKFYDGEGKLLSEHTVRDGEYPEPPDSLNIGNNQIFTGWSNNTNIEVHDNMSIYPEFISFDGFENVIYTNAQYVTKNEALVTDVFIDGKVEFNRLDLKIKYDNESLKFINQSSEYHNSDLHIDEKNGEILLSITSDKNIISKMILDTIEFKVIGQPYTYSNIEFHVDNIQKKDNNDDEIGGDSTSYDGKIYIYQ